MFFNFYGLFELDIHKIQVKLGRGKQMLEQEIHIAKANAKQNRNRETDVRAGNITKTISLDKQKPIQKMRVNELFCSFFMVWCSPFLDLY